MPKTEWLEVLVGEGTHFRVALHEESRIDAAMQRLVDTKGVDDTVLHLDAANGDWQITVLASSIYGFAPVTSAVRRALTELENAVEHEEQELRKELGMWDDGTDGSW